MPKDRRETVFFCELYGETGIAVTGGDLREKFVAVCTKSYKGLRGERESLPEGSSYLGFIFARAPSAAAQAKAALRAAQACLCVVVMPLWQGVSV